MSILWLFAVVAVAVTTPSPGLSGAPCSKTDPCFCTGCCQSLKSVVVECGSESCRGAVEIAVCVGGQNEGIAAESYCVGCCSDAIQTGTNDGNCLIASPTAAANSEAGQRPASRGEAEARQRHSMDWLLALQQGLMVGSPDGNIDVMRAPTPAQLYVVSSVGTILREIDVKPPNPARRPHPISLAAENHLVMKLETMPTRQNPYPRSTFALFDPSTGSIIDVYDLPSSLPGGAIFACATEHAEILFQAGGAVTARATEVLRVTVLFE